MEWKSELLSDLQWSGPIVNRESKEKIARKVAAFADDGDVIGVGSGSTVYLALQFLAERVYRENLTVEVIAASREAAMTCAHLGFRQSTLWEKRPDWTFDGADEIDPEHNLIKGRGGALFKEKLLICSSPLVYIIADETKFVPRLGSHFPVPVEVFPWALSYVEKQMLAIGGRSVVLRPASGKDGAVLTENGNFLLDVWFDSIGEELEKQIKSVSGVIESGLFIRYPVTVLNPSC